MPSRDWAAGRQAYGLLKSEDFMRGVMRRHTKLVYALMRAIDPREMHRLSYTCRKIRGSDVVTLIKELMMEDED